MASRGAGGPLETGPGQQRGLQQPRPVDGPVAEQIVGDAGFVQKHEVGRIPGRRRRMPRAARRRDVRPIVFGWADRFF